MVTKARHLIWIDVHWFHHGRCAQALHDKEPGMAISLDSIFTNVETEMGLDRELSTEEDTMRCISHCWMVLLVLSNVGCELFVSMLLLSARQEHRVLNILQEVMPRGGLRPKSESQAWKFTFGIPDIGLVSSVSGCSNRRRRLCEWVPQCTAAGCSPYCYFLPVWCTSWGECHKCRSALATSSEKNASCATLVIHWSWC